MRLLWFNLAVDADDPVLGSALSWIRTVAKNVEFMHIITMRAGRLELPANVRVHSLGKEKGYSELRRAVEFYRYLFKILRQDRVDVCFSHMNPLFTVLGAPVLRAKGIPIVTWFTHPSLTTKLKLAHWVSARMVTGLATSYRYRRDKLVVLGHGIDTELFAPDETVAPDDPPLILCVGRLSAVKDHPTLLQAAHLLRQRWDRPFQVLIIGGPATLQDQTYVHSLHRQVQDLGLQDIVRFGPGMPPAELPPWHRRCVVHVNLTPLGFGDKVAFESMSCGNPCLVANPDFRETLGRYAESLLFRHGDAADLAVKLQAILQLPERERRATGAYLRNQVVQMHSLEQIGKKIVNLCAELSGKQ